MGDKVAFPTTDSRNQQKSLWTEIIQSRSLDCVLTKTTPILNQPKPFTSHSSAAEDVCSSKMNLSRPLSSKLIAK